MRNSTLATGAPGETSWSLSVAEKVYHKPRRGQPSAGESGEKLFFHQVHFVLAAFDAAGQFRVAQHPKHLLEHRPRRHPQADEVVAGEGEFAQGPVLGEVQRRAMVGAVVGLVGIIWSVSTLDILSGSIVELIVLSFYPFHAALG